MDIITRANELMTDGQVCCLATIISSDRPDISAGRKVLVLTDGTLEFETGLDRLDQSIRNQALAVIREKKRCIQEIQKGLRVFFDLLARESALVV